MQKSIIIFLHKYTLWHAGKNVRFFLPLPFVQETSFFSAFLHGFNSKNKISSVVRELYVTSQQEPTLGSPLTGW